MLIAQDVDASNPFTHTLSTPLQDVESEQGLLGILLEKPGRLSELGWFRSDWFHDPYHSQIFDHLLKAVSSGARVDLGSMKSWADAMPPVEGPDRTITCYQYLQRLVAFAPLGLSARGFAEAVRDCWIRRQLVGIGQDITDGLNRGVDIPVVVRHVQDSAFDLSEQGNARNTRVSAAEAMSRAIDAFNTAAQNGGRIPGVSTGLADLDEKIGGLGNGNLIVLAGRPAMGKTALAGTMTKAAARAGKSVLFFTLEMSADQLAARMISEETEINGERLTRGRFDESEFRRAYDAAQTLGRMPITFDETGAITAAQVALQARRAALGRRLDLIVIDYLQLMGSDRRAENRTQELTKITMSLKALAKSLNVPILLLSQLSREVEKRADKRPQLADLRESGSIEQDADLVLFVYRDEYYLSREQPDVSDAAAYTEYQQRLATCSGTAEVIAAKNRYGSTGIVKLAFDANRTAFADLARGGRHA